MRWEGTTFSDSNADAIQAIALCTADELRELTSPTLVRIRGVFDVALNSSGSVDTQPVVNFYWGIIALEEEAVAADVIPAPETSDLAKPWLYTHAAKLTIGSQQLPMFTSAGAFTNLRTGYHHYNHSMYHDIIDVQAMRKIPDGQGIYLVKTFALVSGTSANVTFLGQFRCLLKE